MKKNYLKRVSILIQLITILGFTTGCSNDDFLFMNYYPDESYFQQYIEINNIESGPKSKFERQQFINAAQRFSDKLTIKNNNTIHLTNKITSEDINISPQLFNIFCEVVDIWNENPSVIMHKPSDMTRSKSNNPESTSTRGGNIICDAAATIIYNTTVNNGWTLTAKLFNMWYFENRSSLYTLSTDEWSPIASYSKNAVGNNYKDNAFIYNGQTYYRKELSFYNAGSDLKFSLGSSNISFNNNGSAVGLSDIYNFNAGDRSFINESITAVIRWIGNEGGFEIGYGIYQ